MGIDKDHPKVLIVEGHDDKFSVVSLMAHHIAWPDDKELCPVYIEVGGSVTEILAKGYLVGKVKERRLQVMGVMLDTDDGAATGRYQRLYELLSPLFPDLPHVMPEDGLIVENVDQKRLGIWLMPDNNSAGCMEVFLRYLVPDESEPVWQHAVKSVEIGRGLGAPCRAAHIPKAELFTWLAWQDEPGYSPGRALTKKILDPHSSHAGPFVEWFKQLFAVT